MTKRDNQDERDEAAHPRVCDVTLGAYPELGLEAARKAAAAVRQLAYCHTASTSARESRASASAGASGRRVRITMVFIGSGLEVRGLVHRRRHGLRNVGQQAALADRDVAGQHMLVGIVAAVLRPEGDRRVVEQAF